MSFFFSSHKAERSAPQNILIDTANNTLVAISTYAPALFFLQENMTDGYLFWNICIPNLDSILKAGPRSYPEWSYDGTKRELVRTSPKGVTDALRERAYLGAKKAEAVRIVIEWVNRRRQERVGGGLLFQEVIYAEKERQAKLVRDENYGDEKISKIPYVVHDADKSGTSLREAAEEILLHAQLDHDLLAQTERTRRELLGALKVATTVEQVQDVIAATGHYSL